MTTIVRQSRGDLSAADGDRGALSALVRELQVNGRVLGAVDIEVLDAPPPSG